MQSHFLAERAKLFYFEPLFGIEPAFFGRVVLSFTGSTRQMDDNPLTFFCHFCCPFSVNQLQIKHLDLLFDLTKKQGHPDQLDYCFIEPFFLEPTGGFEPSTYSLPWSCSSN